jgi:hypothetical protein
VDQQYLEWCNVEGGAKMLDALFILCSLGSSDFRSAFIKLSKNTASAANDSISRDFVTGKDPDTLLLFQHCCRTVITCPTTCIIVEQHFSELNNQQLTSKRNENERGSQFFLSSQCVSGFQRSEEGAGTLELFR